VGNEAAMLAAELNARFGADEFTRVDLVQMRRLVTCCVSQCDVAEPATVAPVASVDGFRSRLLACAIAAWGER
jgi:hypothetical protein